MCYSKSQEELNYSMSTCTTALVINEQAAKSIPHNHEISCIISSVN